MKMIHKGGFIELTSFFLTAKPNHRILLAFFIMEGKALIWFQNLEVSRGITSWEAFVKARSLKNGVDLWLMRILWRLLQS